MSLGAAKHERGTTLGSNPQLYPYVMEHISETPPQVELRNEIVKKERSNMMGSPDEAQFLGWLAATLNARRILEVGVFRGSTTLALALMTHPDCKIVGLDVSEEFAELGKEAWAKAGVANKIDLRIAPAIETMDKLIAAEAGTYDLAFIDADKVSYIAYYEKCLELLRVGGVIAVDNVLWSGEVILPAEKLDEHAKTIVTLNELIKNDRRVSAVLLPVADGCYMVRKL